MNIPHHGPKFLSNSVSFYEISNSAEASTWIGPEKSKTETHLEKLNGEKYQNIITSLSHFKKMKREYILRLQSIVIDSQNKISRAFRKYKIKLMNKKGFYFCSFYYSNFKSIKSNVYIIGEFSPSFWRVPIKMKYDNFFHSFKCDLFIKEGTQFKFIENEKYQTSFDYKVTYDKLGYQNNIFVLNHKSLPQTNSKTSRNSRGQDQKFPVLNFNIPGSNFNFNNSTKTSNLKLNSKNLQLLDSFNAKNLEKFEQYPILDEILRKKSDLSESKDMNLKKGFNERNEEEKLIKENLDQKLINQKEQEKSLRDEDSNTTELDENLNNQANLQTLTYWNERDLRNIDKILESLPTKDLMINMKKSKEKNDFLTNMKNLTLVSASCCIPKSKDSCEDSYFILDNAIGVSDGVGGWSNYGFSAELFSQHLMKNCQDLISGKTSTNYFPRKRTDTVDSFFSENENNVRDIISKPLIERDISPISWAPEKVLQAAFAKVNVPGSSTALLCILSNNQLRCCSVGDSKLLVVKMEGSKAVKLFTSKGQQHDFNTPFQLANIPNHKSIDFLISSKSQIEKAAIQEKLKNVKFCCDSPEDGESYQILVNKNDLLILGTDGLFDNLFEHEILEIIQNHLSNKKVINKENLELLAYSLAKKAKDKSNDCHCESPFKESYLKELQEKWNGGKIDDITVIVSLVE